MIVKIKEVKEKYRDPYIFYNNGFVFEEAYVIDANLVSFSNKLLENAKNNKKPFKYRVNTSEIQYDNLPDVATQLESWGDSIEKEIPLIDTQCVVNYYDKKSTSFHIFITDDADKRYIYVQEKYYELFRPLFSYNVGTMFPTLKIFLNSDAVVFRGKGDCFLAFIMRVDTQGKYQDNRCYFEKQFSAASINGGI